MNLIEDFKAMSTVIMDHIKTFKSFPTQKNLPKPLEPPTVILDNRRDPPFNGGQSIKIGDM